MTLIESIDKAREYGYKITTKTFGNTTVTFFHIPGSTPEYILEELELELVDFSDLENLIACHISEGDKFVSYYNRQTLDMIRNA